MAATRRERGVTALGRVVEGVIASWEGVSLPSGASPLRGRGVRDCGVRGAYCPGAASSRPLRGVGGGSQRRGRSVGRASAVVSAAWEQRERGTGISTAWGRHRCVGGASQRCGIGTLSFSTHSILPLS